MEVHKKMNEFLDNTINQGGEAFLIIFLFGGALLMVIWAAMSNPKKFFQAIMKDLVNAFREKSKEKKENDENE